MAAYANIGPEFHIGDKISQIIDWREVNSVQVDGDELNWAIKILRLNWYPPKRVWTFIGIEAQTIIANWYVKDIWE